MKHVMALTLLQVLAQLSCARGIDLDPATLHMADMADLLAVYTAQTSMEEMAQIVSTKSNLRRLHLIRKRRRRILLCIMTLTQRPERKAPRWWMKLSDPCWTAW